MTDFHGVLPALVTPLHEDGTLNEKALEALLERLYGEGCHGVYVAGNTGEGLQLSVELREKLAAAVRRRTPADRSVIVHAGASSTSEAIRLVRHAEKIGATAVSSLAPPGPYSFADLREYYAALAAASRLPLLVYYFPEVAPTIRTYDQLVELCQIPNVAGLKFTDFDFYTLSRLKVLGKVVFNGRDEAFACGLLMGANGGIGSFYNIAPDLFVDVYRKAHAADWAGARAVQERINQLISIVIGYPLFPAIKQIVAWQGIDCGICVAPRRPLSLDEQSRLRRDLTDAGFLAG